MPLVEPPRHRLTALVAIPAHNAAATLPRTLASVEASLARHLAESGEAAEAFLTVVVDDGSADGTAETARGFAATSWMNVAVLENRPNRGVSASRNRAAGAAPAGFLFYLDADDEFLPAHIPLCLAALRGAPEAAFVKTGVELSDPVHPDWQARIENSLPINLCLRTQAHAMIGGFYEEPVMNRLHCEDVFYSDLLDRFFNGLRLKAVTTRYYRVPGNAFDRQYHKLTRPAADQVEAFTPSEREALPQVLALHEARIAELSRRFAALRE
ncbi:MAG: glycosyltransferase family 2 protein [Rhodospirillales bacterium]|nr:glycosyltransferase family 2 protein [Rhodospirillales bacterium]